MTSADGPGETLAVGLQRHGMLVERYRYLPGPPVELPRHSHRQYQINLNLGTAAGVHYRGGFHAVAPGTITVIMPEEPHRARDPESRPSVSDHLTCYPDPEHLRGLAAELGRRGLPVFDLVITDAELTNRFASMLETLRNAPGRLPREAMVLGLFATMIIRHSPGADPAPIAPAPEAVRRARDFLHAHPLDNVSLDELATVAGLSPYHLSRQFRARLGVPPHRYQLQLRLERAKRLLAAGHGPSEVSHAVGFFDLSHFSRHFKRQVGVPPGRYGNSR